MGEVVAALDCGTNSTRVLIASATGEPLAREMRITRLGQGVDASGALASEAIDRVLAALREFRDLMDHFGVTRGRLAATSAARDASNGSAFLAAASEVAGVEAEILSGEEEGALSFAGAMAGLAPSGGDDVVLDIGGGSTEVVLSRDGVLFAHSMQVGCVRVAERTLASDPPSAEELAAARSMAEVALDGAYAAIPQLRELRPGSRLVGLAGTVATLAMLDQGLVDYDRERVHHHWLSIDAVTHWRIVLSSEDSEARRRRPGMVPGREDVILGGLVVLEACLERFGLEGLLTSESDILDGMVAALVR